MKYPYERFLRFLVSRKANLEEAIDRYGLPRPGVLWEARARASMRESAPLGLIRYWDDEEQPYVIARGGILEWAEDEGFRCLWEVQREFGQPTPPPELDQALRIFVNPHARGVMGLLMLSRVTQDTVVEIMEERFNIELDANTIPLFRELFWDIGIVPRSQWGKFAKSLLTAEERHLIGMGLSNPREDDVRDILEMELVLDHSQVVDQIVMRSYRQFKLAMDTPNPEMSGAIRWADLALKAINTNRGTVTQDDLSPGGSGFTGLFSVEISKSSHPTLAELQGHVEMPEKRRSEEE